MSNEIFDEGQMRAWLDTLYGDTEGLISIVSTGNWAGRTCRTVDEAVNYIKTVEKRKPQGIYARATTLAAAPSQYHRGGNADAHEFIGFWADLDIAGPGHKTGGQLPATVEDCIAITEATGLPAPTEWVHSGGGMYPWWLLTSPHRIHDHAAMAALSARWQRVIELASLKLGFSYGAGIGDLARVLRIPGTVNRKVEDAHVTAQWRTDLATSIPYELPYLVDCLDEAVARLEPPKPAPAPYNPTPVRSAADGLLPGAAYNAATTWDELLTADGWSVWRQAGGYTEWQRPGKESRPGLSATSNYKGADVLHIFTDGLQSEGLIQNENYDRFGYYVRTRHNGDFTAATRHLAAEGFGDPLPPRTSITYDSFDPSPQPAAVDAPASTTATVTAAPKAQQTLTMTWTDSGVADRMQLRHGDEWRHVATREKRPWLRWDGTVWVTDKRGGVTNHIDTLAAEAWNEAQEAYDKAEAAQDGQELKKCEKLLTAIRPALGNARQMGATSVFSRRPQIAVTEQDLDATRERVTLPNGVLNLDTYEFGPFDRTMLATKKLGVAFDAQATAPRWRKFLEQVLPDPAMRDYLQRAAGYTLLGKPVRKAIFMLHSSEPNTGKSQVINALQAMFGDFGVGTKEQTFRINESPTAATPALHKLKGARLVTASEFNEGARLDEALIKAMTGGGDSIESRGLYQDEESWLPDFSMWLASNHLPKFNADDNAIWRRVKPIHFPVVFGAQNGPEEVMDIGRTLVAEEGPGILNWLLEGVKAYRERGLDEPQALTDGVAAYRREADPVARFLAAAADEGTVTMAPDQRIEAKMLYDWFKSWCQDEGIKNPLPANRFGVRLAALKYVRTKDSSGRVRMWQGIGAAPNTWQISGHPLLT